jgi:transmembrane sensor
MSLERMKANQHTDNQDWELLAKSIYDPNPETSAEDQAVAERILPDDSDRTRFLEMTRKVDTYFDLKKYPADKAWDKVEARIHESSAPKQTILKRLIQNPLYRVAAAILFAALLLVSGYEVYNSAANGKMLEVSATNQILKTFALPDGSLVSLNTDTKIKYPKLFAGNTREVSIEGEAFFQVKPNKEKPFIIHAGNAQIKVLGTSFNVNAYPAAKLVEVIVETGKVRVSAQTNESNELILMPGDKGTLVYSGHSLLKSTNADPNFLAWKTRNLIFKATSLAEVIVSVEKVYKVDIQLADPKLNELLLTARFNDYSLDFILKVIETTFQIETQKVNGQYILKAKS